MASGRVRSWVVVAVSSLGLDEWVGGKAVVLAGLVEWVGARLSSSPGELGARLSSPPGLLGWFPSHPKETSPPSYSSRYIAIADIGKSPLGLGDQIRVYPQPALPRNYYYNYYLSFRIPPSMSHGGVFYSVW